MPLVDGTVASSLELILRMLSSQVIIYFSLPFNIHFFFFVKMVRNNYREIKLDW